MTNLLVVITFVFAIIGLVSGEDSYTPEERVAIKAFRELIKDGLTQNYMHENKYLIRWLRARNLNLKDAEQMIRRNFAWRKEYKLDNILSEDWSQYEIAYPFNFRLRDHEGRPALSTRLGKINIRNLIISGQRERIRRYLIYGLERAIFNIHKVSNETGKEFIGTHLLFNMAGYDLRTHSCFQCITGWINLVNNYESYFPNAAETVIVVNTPRIFETLYSILRVLGSTRSQEVVRLYGLNKAEWKTELLKIYPEDQLTPEFGGTFKF